MTNLTLLDKYGASRKTLEGGVTQKELASLMIDEWVSYFECHKCDKYNYCKFSASSDQDNSSRSIDKKCGVRVSIMKNYVNSCFSLLLRCNYEQKQDFLDASFYFTDFVNYSERLLTAYLNDDLLDYFENGHLFFGYLAHLRYQLDQIAMHLKSIPEFRVIRGFFLVEGESEMEFVKTLSESQLSWFYDVWVESYGGKGNRRPAKLLMLADFLKEKGFKIYIQGDKDSKNNDIFLQLQNKIPELNTFAFSHDFESSIPADLLFQSLKQIGCLKNVSFYEFRYTIEGFNEAVQKCLKIKWDVDLDRIKVRLAKEVARQIIKNELWTSEEFWKSELGKFVNFIIQGNIDRS